MPNFKRVGQYIQGPMLIILAVFPASLAYALLTAVMALRLERDGVSPWLIGVNTAVFPFAILITSQLIPWLIRRSNSAILILAGMAMAGAGSILMGYYHSYTAWCLLRFGVGVGVAVLWLVAEAWLHAIVPENNRGRYHAWYAISLAVGFALGPQIVNLSGIDGLAPFTLTAAIGMTAGFAFFSMRVTAPQMILTSVWAIRPLLTKAPLAMGLALVGGAIETALFGLVPLFTIDIGLTVAGTLALISAFAIGHILLQPPLAILIDHISEKKVMIALTLSASLMAILLPFFAGTVFLWPMVVIWGGLVYGFYNLGITSLSHRFSPSELIKAHSVFVMSYQVGGILGPLAVGTTITLWGGMALPFSLASLALSVPCGIWILMGLQRWFRANQEHNK